MRESREGGMGWRRVAGGGGTLLLSIGTVLVGCETNNSDSDPTSQAQTEVEELSDDIFMQIPPRQTDQELSRRAKRLGVVVVDGRCDPNPDAPVGLYHSPQQTAPGTAPERAVTGDVFEVQGVVTGDALGNDAWSSDHWYEVTIPQTNETFYMPIVWGQGEATLQE